MGSMKPYAPILVLTNTGQDYVQSFAAKTPMALAINIVGTIDKQLLQLLIEGDIPFMLLISHSGENIILDSGMMEIIKLAFFSRNYIRLNDVPVLAFSNQQTLPAGQQADNTHTNAFTEALQLQGWPVITQWHLAVTLSFREQIYAHDSHALFINEIDVDEDFLLQSFFSQPLFIGTYIFFHRGANHTAIELEARFLLLCRSAISRYTLLDTYISNYLSEKTGTGKLLIEKNTLLERLANAEKTIAVIRTKYKDDYDILFNWYQNEYEVLPLWYKRFGHIIKVLTGKRSLKSLFNDDEKKRAGY